MDHDLFQVNKLSEDQKKRKGLHQNWKKNFSRFQVKNKKKVFTKYGRLFYSSEGQKTAPNIIQRSDADQSQIIGEGCRP